tara:strand:- start:648 stop:1277 length:630 start_codon:yes stop_codon:yes gene_type:complete
MEPKQYTVAWNTGCMGHLIKAIIGIEKYSIDFEHAGSDSHYIGHALHSLPIGHIHPFDPDKITAEANVIRPYFGDERLKYFPKYLNYIKMKTPTTAKQFARVYHRYEEPKCTTCYNIDMTNFLLDPDKFNEDLRRYFASASLKDKTIEFIANKRKSNMPFYDRYLEITDRQLKTETIGDLNQLELGVLICHTAGNDFDETFNLIGKFAE